MCFIFSELKAKAGPRNPCLRIGGKARQRRICLISKNFTLVKNGFVYFSLLCLFLLSEVVGYPAQFPAPTSTGFYYPTGRPPDILEGESYGYAENQARTYYTGCAGWLARYDKKHYPEKDRYHLGQDISGKDKDPVFAIADGEICYISYGGWGEGLCAVFIKHTSCKGDFLALYGHITIASLKDFVKQKHYELPQTTGKVTPPVPVKGGEKFAELGRAPDVSPHLHFGIVPGTNIPITDLTPNKERGYGRMNLSYWTDARLYPPDTNGFVDPIKWIQTVFPKDSKCLKIITATILVMDVSGSMAWPWRGGVKIESAKKAALQYIEQVAKEPRPAGVTHYIGVVTFSDGANVACPLSSNYDEAKKTVISLGTIASTNLGAGLDTALQELNKLPGAKKFIILLSDGMTNTGKSREAILRTSVTEARRQGICIHTVGFGDPGDIDEDFLKKIAAQSGCGSYNYASSGFELFTTYVKVRHATLGSNRIVEYKTTTPAYFLPGQSITLGAFQLTAPAQELHYTVAWSGPVVLQAKLVDPKGRVVDSRYPNTVIYSGNGFSHITVFSPIPGVWRAAATVKSAAVQPAEYYGVASARTGGYVIPYIPPPCLVQVDDKCLIPMPDLPTVVIVAIGMAVWIWWLYNQFGGFLP